MKVTQTDVISNLLNTNADRFSQNKSKKTGTDGQAADIKDSYELNLLKTLQTPETDAVYSNPKFDMNSLAVENLMQESDDIHDSVIKLVTDMLQRQGYTEEQIKTGELGEITVDEIAQEEAQKLIGPGGMFSPENVSDRIVDFAIGVFGGDKSKIDIIRTSIDKGFAEAEKILGGLADVSKTTYDMIQEKLDAWINDGESEVESGGEEEAG